MFDSTTTHTSDPAATDWRLAIRIGDVVSFRFPHAERDDDYRPKARPCLVLDVTELVGERFVTLAYGTSVRSASNRGDEIHVCHAEVIRAAGLDRPTRFVGARRVTVSVNHPGFCDGDRGTPNLARLGGTELERLAEVRERIRARGDMAAETHAARRRRRLKTEGRDTRPARKPAVVVEHRRRRRASAGPGLAR